MEGFSWLDVLDDSKLEQFKQFITSDNINQKDCFDHYALTYAIVYNHRNCFDYLLSSGADVNVNLGYSDATYNLLHVFADYERSTTLYYARCIIEKRADVNARDDSGQTPLHDAVNGGCAAYVALLIESKANIHAVDMDEDTPLHTIRNVQNTDDMACARLLLSAGAKLKTRDRDGDERYVDSGLLDIRTRLANCRLACVALRRVLAKTQGREHKDVIPMVERMVWETRGNNVWLRRE